MWPTCYIYFTNDGRHENWVLGDFKVFSDVVALPKQGHMFKKCVQVNFLDEFDIF